jgi:hemoglobin/transferrin/lactoferrin receptor protein
LSAALAGANVAAATKPVEIVRVTSARIDPAAVALPYSTTTLSRADTDRLLVRSLPEALALVPGVLVQKSGSGQGSPFLRGFTGYRTLTLIDGVRYNNAVYRDGPNEYFSLIDFAALDTVTVLGGPASVLYGSDAIGGTLNLQTQSSAYAAVAAGERFLHGRQRITAASADHSRQSRTELQAGTGGRFGIHAGVSLRDFGNIDAAGIGKQHHTGYGESAWDLRADANLAANWHLTVAAQSLTRDDVWRTFSTVFANGYAGTSRGTDLRRLKDQQRQFAYARVSGPLAAGFADNAGLTVSRQRWDEDGDRLRGDGRRNREFFTSTMLGVELRFDKQLGPATFVYGYDCYRDAIDSSRSDVAADGQSTVSRIQGPVGDDARFVQQGIYGEAIVAFAHGLRVDLGGRYTHVAARVGRYEDPLSGRPARFDDAWGAFVGSIRAAYTGGERFPGMLWIGLSEAFRAPNIADVSRFGASRSNEIEVAAPTLDAEKFLTLELGGRFAMSRVSGSATAYYTRIRDFITSTPTGAQIAGLTAVTKQNSARGYLRGIELAASVALVGGFETWANVTWLEGELDTITSVASRTRITEPLSRSMPLTSNLGLRWQSQDRRRHAALDVTLAATADRLSTGDMNDTQRIPPGGTPGYAVVDLMLAATLHRRVDVVARLENIFDEDYRTHGSGVNEPGRGINVALTYAF